MNGGGETGLSDRSFPGGCVGVEKGRSSIKGEKIFLATVEEDDNAEIPNQAEHDEVCEWER